MKQGELFPPYPRQLYGGIPPHQPVDTSRAAAINIAPHANAQRMRVLKALLGAGATGLTDEEIGAALALGGNSVRPRRKELVELGSVRDIGLRRKTHSGRKAIAWVVVGP